MNMTSSVERFEKRSENVDVSLLASTSCASAIIGVMPLPAAMPTTCAPSSVSSVDVKVPCGLMTSIRSPGRSSLFAHVEKRPPRSRLMATEIEPRLGGRQMEYERRISWPSIVFRSARC